MTRRSHASVPGLSGPQPLGGRRRRRRPWLSVTTRVLPWQPLLLLLLWLLVGVASSFPLVVTPLPSCSSGGGGGSRSSIGTNQRTVMRALPHPQRAGALSLSRRILRHGSTVAAPHRRRQSFASSITGGIPTTASTRPLWSSFSTVAQPSQLANDDDKKDDNNNNSPEDHLLLRQVVANASALPELATDHDASVQRGTANGHAAHTLSTDDNPIHTETPGSSSSSSSPALSSSSPSTTTTTTTLDEEFFQQHGLQSRPVPGGNWDPRDPLHWTRDFGRPSRDNFEKWQRLARLQPGDEGYFALSDDDMRQKLPMVTMVRNKADAEIVLAKLQAAATDGTIFHACDTEVMAIDLKSVGPVGNGYVTCVSVYSGPDFDYGLGQGPGSVLWIDNLDDAFGVLDVFKPWFENEAHWKVWHNYGFDRHVMWNHGIDVKGFGGDTMHMARLQDSSRARSSTGTGAGYSLEALTEELINSRKRPMKEIFGVKRRNKDGSEGKLVDIPPVEVMQRDPKHRVAWIQYSSFDAQSTWRIRQELEERLKNKPWFYGLNLYDYYMEHMRPFGEVLTDMERRGIRVDARDYLAKVELQAREDRAHHSRVFREWASKQIGPDGWALNTASSVQLQTFLFGGSRNSKTGELTETVRVFKVPTVEIPQEAVEAYQKRDEELSKKKTTKEPNDGMDELSSMKVVHLKKLCKEQGLKVSGRKADLQERLREHYLNAHQSDMGDGKGHSTLIPEGTPTMHELDAMSDNDLADAAKARGLSPMGSREELLGRIREDIEFVAGVLAKESPNDHDGYVRISEALAAAAKKEGGALSEYLEEFKLKSSATPKYTDVTVTSLGKLEPEVFTQGGAPSVTASVLKKLAGDPFADPPKYGSAYKSLGKEGCEALFSLCSIGSIDTMIANFLTSLQELADDQSRVHCSLNLNTETGRLSSRRPNLQNQPALEKDKYKIRQAFQSSSGNNLIVADYGQLELRILASMTKCQSMINAFEAGGDFHSRTAVDMFDYVKAKVDSGEVLLEWDYSQGECPKPLVKDEFASERRKAKTLNFSIAYGKTAHGLSLDWGVSQKEAQDMLQKWYDARPEVRDWQATVKNIARTFGFTRTLMGRYRELPEAQLSNRKLVGAAERASINTPIQGGAADIAMMAMNKINKSEKLKKLGWILLLQIHDEVILEGPEETAKEAFEEVLKCMEQPWCRGLEKTAVPLLVDGSFTHKTWYDAK